MTDGVGPRLCARWVRCYTRRLPAGVAAQRRAEIDSDLWEHQHRSLATGRTQAQHEIEVIGRVLSGIPADLSWRRGILRSQTQPDAGVAITPHRRTELATTTLRVLAAISIGMVVSLLPALLPWALDDGLGWSEVVWVLGANLLAAALAVGLYLRRRRPLLSTALLVVGSLAPSLAWFWLPPVYLVTVAIAVAAIITTPSRPVARSEVSPAI
jgi:hypothetical protein